MPILRLEVLSDEVNREACLSDLVLNLLVCELIGGPLVFDCLRKVDLEFQRRAIQCVTFQIKLAEVRAKEAPWPPVKLSSEGFDLVMINLSLEVLLNVLVALDGSLALLDHYVSTFVGSFQDEAHVVDFRV